MMQVLNAARKRGFASSMRCIVAIDLATTRPGNTLRQFRRQPGHEKPSNTARGAARSAANSHRNRATSSPSSIGVPAALPTPIWICSSRNTASIISSSWGLIAHTCVEATVRYAAELGYEVTMVKDATADYSDEEMHAALDVNIPNYASGIVTTNEVVDSIASL
jgi:hypothetical protein